jgi:hypothetical protein
MNHLLLKFLNIIFGINKVLAAPVQKFRTGDGDGKTITLPNPLMGGETSIVKILGTIARWLAYYIAPGILVIMVMIGGFTILTAGDNPEKVNSGKRIITWAVVGFAIILMAGGVIFLIMELLGARTSTPTPSPITPPYTPPAGPGVTL